VPVIDIGAIDVFRSTECLQLWRDRLLVGQVVGMFADLGELFAAIGGNQMGEGDEVLVADGRTLNDETHAGFLVDGSRHYSDF
jgi:hypothetical protein